MKLGAYDYLTKPFDVELLILTLERAVERHRLHSRIEELKRQGQGSSLAERMGGSPAIAQVIQQVAQVAESNFTVLVQGETGTGKELVARAIHQQSPRRQSPFVAVDCGAIPETLVESELFGHERGAFTGAQARREGHFQLAKGGTLFLDEIGNVPLATQAKLLRALEQREVHPLGGARAVTVDARIIAATNSELEESVKAGRFRADLYYRLSEFTIALPPLRSRREDIMHLSQRFLDEVSMELRRPVRRISDEAMQVLLHHDWPGNVRELRNVVRKAALLATDVVTPEHIPALSASAPAPRARRRRAGGRGSVAAGGRRAGRGPGRARGHPPRARVDQGQQEPGRAAPPDRLHDAPREDEALRHLRPGLHAPLTARPWRRPYGAAAIALVPLRYRAALPMSSTRVAADPVSSWNIVIGLPVVGPRPATRAWHCTCPAMGVVSHPHPPPQEGKA